MAKSKKKKNTDKELEDVENQAKKAKKQDNYNLGVIQVDTGDDDKYDIQSAAQSLGDDEDFPMFGEDDFDASDPVLDASGDEEDY